MKPLNSSLQAGRRASAGCRACSSGCLSAADGCCRLVLWEGAGCQREGGLVFFSWGKETDVNGKAGEKRWSSLVWLCSNECVVMCLYLPNK